MKKKLLCAVSLAIACSIFQASANAQQMKMYIRNYYVERDVTSYGGIDMLPAADIACELGYTYYKLSDTTFALGGYYNVYYFELGNASAYDYWGNWIGLDAVPMIMNDKFRIPSTFLTKTLKMSYTWDRASNTIYVNSTESLNKVRASMYIAHQTSHKFHKPTCIKLPAEYNRIYFMTRDDAINAGMTPCKYCNP